MILTILKHNNQRYSKNDFESFESKTAEEKLAIREWANAKINVYYARQLKIIYDSEDNLKILKGFVNILEEIGGDIINNYPNLEFPDEIEYPQFPTISQNFSNSIKSSTYLRIANILLDTARADNESDLKFPTGKGIKLTERTHIIVALDKQIQNLNQL